MIAFAKKVTLLVRCAARYWNSDGASTTGAAQALYRAFSLAPLQNLPPASEVSARMTVKEQRRPLHDSMLRRLVLRRTNA
jgi:hypothetical protein